MSGLHEVERSDTMLRQSYEDAAHRMIQAGMGKVETNDVVIVFLGAIYFNHLSHLTGKNLDEKVESEVHRIHNDITDQKRNNYNWKEKAKEKSVPMIYGGGFASFIFALAEILK